MVVIVSVLMSFLDCNDSNWESNGPLINNKRALDDAEEQFIDRQLAVFSVDDGRPTARGRGCVDHLVLWLEKKRCSLTPADYTEYVSTVTLTTNQIRSIYNVWNRITPDANCQVGVILAMNYLAPRQQQNLNVKKQNANRSSGMGTIPPVCPQPPTTNTTNDVRVTNDGDVPTTSSPTQTSPTKDDGDDGVTGPRVYSYETSSYYNSQASKLAVQKYLRDITILGSNQDERVVCSSLVLRWANSTSSNDAVVAPTIIIERQTQRLINEALLPQIRSYIFGMEIKEVSVATTVRRGSHATHNFECYVVVYVPNYRYFILLFKELERAFDAIDIIFYSKPTDFINTSQTQQQAGGSSNTAMTPTIPFHSMSPKDLEFFIYNHRASFYCILTNRYKPTVTSDVDKIIMVLVKLTCAMVIAGNCVSLKRPGLIQSGYNPLMTILFEGGMHETTRFMKQQDWGKRMTYVLSASMEDLFFNIPPACDALATDCMIIAHQMP